MIKPLNELKPYDVGVITDIFFSEIEKVHRFMDLGIYINAKIVMIKKLYQNRLLIIQVDDFFFCLRKHEASQIRVWSE